MKKNVNAFYRIFLNRCAVKNKIVSILKNNGIEEVGFCPFSFVEDRLLSCRAAARLPKGAKTVVMMAFPYKVREEAPEKLSRYAAVPDYHEVLRPRLLAAKEALSAEFPEAQFEIFQDNSPIPEVLAAAAAGLGVVGKNGLLLHKEYGSWVFLGEIVTDLEIACEARVQTCPDCGACARACPSKRVRLDCLSAVTQKKGALTEAEQTALTDNNLLWGCDICAEVCPINKNVRINPVDVFKEGYQHQYEEGQPIKGRAFAWRGEQPIRRNAALYQK